VSYVGAELRGVTLKVIGRSTLVGQSVVPIRALQATLYRSLAGSRRSGLI